MKKPYYTILQMLISVFSCKHDNTVIIKGDIKGLKSKWLYYKPAYSFFSKATDSAKVADGKFEIRFKRDTPFFADLVQLNYLDEKGKQQFIDVANPYEPSKIIPGILFLL